MRAVLRNTVSSVARVWLLTLMPISNSVTILRQGERLKKCQPWGWHVQQPPNRLDHALGQHGLGDLDEASDIGPLHIVDAAILLAMVHAGVVDVLHNAVQTLVHFAGGPVQTHRVLT